MELVAASFIQRIATEKYDVISKENAEKSVQYFTLVLFKPFFANVLLLESDKQDGNVPDLHCIDLAVRSEEADQLWAYIVVCHLKEVNDARVIIFHIAIIVAEVDGTW